jgi:hypothetical protein
MPGNLIDIPNVVYAGYFPGIDFRIPIAPNVAFVLGGRAYLLTSAGDISQAQQYGQAKVTGGEAMGGLDIVFNNRFALRFTGEFAQVGFKFTGNGDQTHRAGDPTQQDVGGAADRYVGGAATLAVLY